MGIFSRRPTAEPSNRPSWSESIPHDPPVKADDLTVGQVAELMELFNNVCGQGPQPIRKIGRAIASAAGLRSIDDAVRGLTGPEVPKQIRVRAMDRRLERPWELLAAVTEIAAQTGQAILAGRIFFFAFYWHTQCDPLLTQEDCADLLLNPVPPQALADMASAALVPLKKLPPGSVIFSNDTGTVHASDVVNTAEMITP